MKYTKSGVHDIFVIASILLAIFDEMVDNTKEYLKEYIK